MKTFTVALIAGVSAVNNGPIVVKAGNADKTLYVVSDIPSALSIVVHHDSITLSHGARAYLGLKPVDELTPENYA